MGDRFAKKEEVGTRESTGTINLNMPAASSTPSLSSMPGTPATAPPTPARHMHAGDAGAPTATPLQGVLQSPAAAPVVATPQAAQAAAPGNPQTPGAPVVAAPPVAQAAADTEEIAAAAEPLATAAPLRAKAENAAEPDAAAAEPSGATGGATEEEKQETMAEIKNTLAQINENGGDLMKGFAERLEKTIKKLKRKADVHALEDTANRYMHACAIHLPNPP